MQRSWDKLGSIVVALGLLCCWAAPAKADGGSARFTIVDSDGNILPDAIVELQREGAKPLYVQQAEKGTWVLKDAPSKVSLTVIHGRTVAIVELSLPEDQGADASFKVVVNEDGIEATSDYAPDGPVVKPVLPPLNSIGAQRDALNSTPPGKGPFEPTLGRSPSSDANVGPPANDNCAGAVAVGSLPATVMGTNVGATDDIAAGQSCGVSSGPFNNIWYTVVGTGGTITVTSCNAGTVNGTGNFDTKISIFCNDCGDKICVGGNDDSCAAGGSFRSTATFCSEAGRTYLITVGGFAAATAEGSIQLDVTEGAACATPPACVRPVNDTCASAAPVGGLPASVVGNNSAAASNITGTPCGVASGPFRELWYSVVGTGGTLTASTCNAGSAVTDTKISVFCGDCAAPACVGGDDDSCPATPPGTLKSVFSWCSEPGRTYLIAVGNFSATTTPGVIQLDVTDSGVACPTPPSCGPPIPPPNDLCDAAIAVAVPSVTPGTTVNSTIDAVPACGTSITTGGVWYTVVGDGNTLTASLCGGASFDTKLSVYCSECATPTCITGIDDFCGLQSQVSWCSTAGEIYRILVHGFGAATGPFTLTMSTSGLACTGALQCGPCEVDCPPGGTPENELNCGLPTDTVNGGCNSTPPVFSPIACGQTYCGTAAFDDVIGFRDTDWYQVTFATDTEFTWTVEAEFEVLMGMVETSPLGTPDCATATALDPFAIGQPCQTVSVTRCVPPGTYWFFVAPTFTVPVACGAEYTARLDCVGCTPPTCNGDTCATATVVPAVPYSTTGDTCICNDNYDEICPFLAAGSPDQVYSYTPLVDECVLISMCANTAYDSKVYVYEDVCGAYQSGVFVACNDDECSTPSLPPPFASEVQANLLAGNTYYIVVDGYGGACGNYTLDITPCPPPCVVDCPPGSTAENELNCGLPTDTVNGGCNSTPPVFSPIACGQTYCASGAFDETIGFRDTDWYQITIASTTEFTWTVEAEFDMLMGLVETTPLGNPDCATAVALNPFAVAGPCEPTSVTICLGPGTYWWFVAPTFDAPVPCPSDYTATLSCVPCIIPVGACCRPDGSCDDGITEASCEDWQGEGTLCANVICPQPPPNDLCEDAIPVLVPSSTAGSTELATTDLGFDSPCGSDAGITSPGVWYSVTGTGNTMTVSLCNAATTFDAKITVFCPSCAEAVCVTGNDDFCGLQPEVSWCSAAGENYLILIHGFGGQTGPFQMDVSDSGSACSPAASCIFVPVCPGVGSCCDPAGNGLPGCKDTECCEAICAIDPFCCDVFWDSICAGEANALCEFCQVTPEGACCQGLGCTIETQADCAAAGGTYLGDGSSCSGPGAGNPQVYEADPGLAIPDGDPFGVSHTINVPGPGVTVGDVNVDLTIPHTWVGDLVVTITHGSTSVTIIDRPGVPALGGFGCDQDNYNLIIIDDEAADAIEDQCTPDLTSPPNYSPNNPLSAFDGMNSAGAWIITVSDNAGFDEGTLDHWSLHIDEPGPSPCIPRGACCTSETMCAVTTEADCTGVYLGDGTDCESLGAGHDYAADPGADIPDNDPAGVSHTINVPDVFNVADVNIDLSVTHTWVGDLVVTVTHGATSVTIIERPGEPALGAFGCDQDNYDLIILDDEGAGGPIEDECTANLTSPPNYTPNDPLSAFDGMPAAGPWIINVSDNAGFDIGTLDHWSLHLQEPGPSPCEGQFTGACCDTNGADQGCVNDVLPEDCDGPDDVFTPGGVCPPAAGAVTCVCIPICTGVPVCGPDGCGGTCGVCTDGVGCTTDACVGGVCVSTPNDAACDNGFFCDGAETCTAGVGCTAGTPPCDSTETCNEDTDTCEGGVIPTVSAWGMVVMVLLLLVAGKVYFGYRRFATEAGR